MMQRFDPFDTLLPLREAMNRLFEESFVGPRFELVSRKSFPINIYETSDQKQLVVEAALPGFKLEQIHVQVEGDVLTIRANQKQEQSTEKGAYVRREITQTEMYRVLSLPVPIDVETIDAIYEHSVLTLRLPKIAAVQPKQIPIKVNEPVHVSNSSGRGKIPAVPSRNAGWREIVTSRGMCKTHASRLLFNMITLSAKHSHWCAPCAQTLLRLFV